MTTLAAKLGALVAHHARMAADPARWPNRAVSAKQEIQDLESLLPSGSGIDNGSQVDLDLSSKDGERIVIRFGYHHMDPNGMYAGWTHHKCHVSSSLIYDLRIKITTDSGYKIESGLRDYLYDCFHTALRSEVQS